MSDPIDRSDPIWFAALRRAHLTRDLDVCVQDEEPNGHRAAPRGCLLGCGPDLRVTHVRQSVRLEAMVSYARDAVRRYSNAAQPHETATALLAVGDTVIAPGRCPAEINKFGWNVPRPVCVDCGHGFYPDSSPHMDRCWECAERDDEESSR